MRKIFVFIALIVTATSCIQTEAPKDPSSKNNNPANEKGKVFVPEPTNNFTSQQINKTFSYNLKKVDFIDARTIYKASLKGDFSKTSMLSIQFDGKNKPSLKIYKDELKSGMAVNIIPPNYTFNKVIVRKFDQNNKVISEIKLNLKKGENNLILI